MSSGMPMPTAAKMMWNASDTAIWERAKPKSVMPRPHSRPVGDPMRVVPLQRDERDDEGHDHHRQQSQLEHRPLERPRVLFEELRELGREHQEATHGGDQPDDQERLRHERVLAEGDLHGVEELDDHQDEEDPVEQPHGTVGQRFAQSACTKATATAASSTRAIDP